MDWKSLWCLGQSGRSNKQIASIFDVTGFKLCLRERLYETNSVAYLNSFTERFWLHWNPKALCNCTFLIYQINMTLKLKEHIQMKARKDAHNYERGKMLQFCSCSCRSLASHWHCKKACRLHKPFPKGWLMNTLISFHAFKRFFFV